MARRTIVSEVGPAPADEALLVGIVDGDTQALETLYDRHSGAVYGLALRMLGLPQAAEEVVQETFWRVWCRSATFQQSRGQPLTWLLGIAHNLCIDELRRQRTRAPIQTIRDDQPLLDLLADDSPSPDEETWHREQRRVVRAALDQLPAEQRHTIELAFFRGLSQREIAEQTLEPLGTVKTRVRLALRKLRELLDLRALE